MPGVGYPSPRTANPSCFIGKFQWEIHLTTLMAGPFGPEKQISSVQGNSLFPERDEETGCTGGAITTSVSRVAWMNLPGLQMVSEGTSSLPTACALCSPGYGEWAEMGTDAPRIVLALDWHLLVAQTQLPGEILSLALAPRAEMQQAQRNPSMRRKPPASQAHVLATIHTSGHWNREGPERKEGWVLMQQKCPVSGERQMSKESTWKQSNVLSLREVTHGQGQWSLCYNNSNNNTSGNMCSSAMNKKHCDHKGTHQGTKQTRSLPCGAPTPGDKEESTSLETVCPGLYMLTVYLSDQFNDVSTPIVPTLQVSKLSPWKRKIIRLVSSRARIWAQAYHTFKNCTHCPLLPSLFSWALNAASAHHSLLLIAVIVMMTGFPGGWVVKNPPDNAGDADSIPGLGERNGNPFQYSRNPLDRGAWQATVLGVAKELDTT